MILAHSQFRKQDMQPPIIKIQNLSKTYKQKGIITTDTDGPIKVLDNISLKIHAGECLAIIGQSGGGKSTFGRCILRLVEPDSGSILFKDMNLLKLTAKQFRKQRPKIQMIFQDALLALNPKMTIAATLTEPLKVLYNFNKKAAVHRAEALLESVGLPKDFLNRTPEKLSGGQRQRVAIARAISTNPEFLIADEPTSSLDAKNKNQIVGLLKDLQIRFNLTLIMISHDLSMVHEIADRIAVMQNGKIVEIAPTQELINSPKHPHTKELASATASELHLKSLITAQ